MSSHFVQTLRRSARTLSKHLYQKVNESIKPSNAAWNASIALLGASAIGIGSAATAAAPDPASSPQPPAPAPQETPQSNDGTAQWRVFTDIARDLVREKRYDEAERYLLRALDAAKRGFGIDDPHVASACQNLAELYRLQQKYDLAAPLYDQALGILAEAYGPKDIRVAFALHNVAGFHYAQRSLDKAAQCYEQALQVKLTSVGPGHMETSNTLYHLGEVRWAQGRKEEGIRLARQSLDILEQQRVSDVACARRRTRLAEMLLEKNAHAEAERLLRKVLDMASGDGSGRAAALENLAKAVQGLGKYDEARSLLQDALTLRRGQGDGAAAASPAVSAVLRKLAEVELASVSGGEAAERDVAVARASEAAAEAVSIAEQAREASLVAAAALAATKVPQKESEPQSGGFLAKLWPLQQPGLVLPPRAARPEVATLELAACLRTQAAVLRILTPDVPDTTCLERALDLLTSSWPGKQAAGKPGAAATARLEELREQSICQTLAAFLVVLKRDKGSGAGHSLQDITSMYKERNCAKLMRGM